MTAISAREIDAVALSPEATPGFIHSNNLKEASAKKASELLTANHNLYHNRWKDTFHNHTVHHILSLWSLGATPEEMQDMYDYNEIYQAPIGDLHKQSDDDASKNLDLSDPQAFQECLGKNEYYADYLNFFKQEMTERGMRAVLKEYVFKGDSRADDIVARLFSGKLALHDGCYLLHPMIHLGCAIEFNQPSIAAEALAAACVHPDWPSIFLAPAKALAPESSGTDASAKPLLDLIHEMRQDEDISDGVRDTDPFNRIPDGFLKRVKSETLAPYLSSYRVQASPEAIQARLAELLHSLAYMLASTQRPGKTERMDFVLLHCMTLAVHFPAIMAQDWISDEEKARLLETKARVDAVMYSGCRCPLMYPERIKSYVPKNPSDGWPGLIQRAIVYRDEGHAAKLIRGLLVQKSLAIPQEPRGEHQVWMSEDDILTVGHMAMDSLEAAIQPGGSHMPEHVAQAVIDRIGLGGEMIKTNMQRWVYYGGLEKAWDFVPTAASS